SSPGIDQRLLRVQEVIAQRLTVNPSVMSRDFLPANRASFSARYLIERAIGVVPFPEVVELSANLLRPHTSHVRKQREVGIGLVWFLGLAAGGEGVRICIE